MFVGETGIGRVVKRTLEVMKELGTDDPAAVRRAGAVDLPTLQKYLNFWFTSSLDLFGSENSSNAATTFANGIKGRPDEANYADHVATEGTFHLETPDGAEDVPMRNAMNEIVREAYVKDCEIGVKRWNLALQRAGTDIRLALLSQHFRRSIGSWANLPVDRQGTLVSREEYDRRVGLYSLPARLGSQRALLISALFHAAMVGLLLVVWRVAAGGWLFAAGITLTVGALVYQHAILRPGDLSRVNSAFFTANGFVSVVLAACGIADVFTS